MVLRSFAREMIKNKYLYLMALPGFIFVFIFSYLPMQAHLIAFQDFVPIKGVWGSRFVGFENIRFFFGSGNWLRVTQNTLLLNLLFISTGTVTSITFAVLLSEIANKTYRRISQSIIVLPHLISYIVVSLIAREFLLYDRGVMNAIITFFGGEPVHWFGMPKIWPFILMSVVIWKNAGWNSIIYFATITGFSEEIYESARIDGANKLQQIFRITLPMLRPTIVVLVLLALGKIFYGDFGLIYNMVNENPQLIPTTDVIDTFTYRALRSAGNYSMAAAVALFQSAMGFICIVFFNWAAGRIDGESKLF